MQRRRVPGAKSSVHALCRSVAGPSPHLGNLGRSLSTGSTGWGDSFKLLELSWSNEA